MRFLLVVLSLRSDGLWRLLGLVVLVRYPVLYIGFIDCGSVKNNFFCFCFLFASVQYHVLLSYIFSLKGYYLDIYCYNRDP